MSAPFLPLTRPTIDEATIAGVGEVLRSGWITSGPKVKELEAQLSARCGGRPVRVKTGLLDGAVVNAQPEWDDVAAAAAALGRPAKDVLAEAAALARTALDTPAADTPDPGA